MALGLPQHPETDNVRSLSYWKSERMTGITGDTLTCDHVIDPEAHLLFKNGSLVDPSTYTIDGQTITGLSPASSSGDVWILHYHFRPL